VQTFLALPPELTAPLTEGGHYSYKNSARILDNRRLSKQRIEGYQILKVLSFNDITDKPPAWYNHPALLQWKGYEWSLFDYICDICLVWKEERGFKDTIYDKLDDLTIPGPTQEVLHPTLPPWMGNIDFHRSHRSRLLFKGRVDAALKALKSFLPKGIDIKHWMACDETILVFNHSTIKNFGSITSNELQQIEDFLFKNKVEIPSNHYTQFGWGEPDNLPYVWPVRKNVAIT